MMELVIKYIFLFFIYSFMGFIWETIWVSFEEKKLVDRGFLYGPILPIYGFGVFFITLFLNAINIKDNNVILIFIFSIIISTFLELITGIVIEKIFKVRYWNYDDRFLNYKGFICLRSSLFFGFVCIFIYKYLNPYFFNIYEKIKGNNLNLILLSLTFLFICDVIISARDATTFIKLIEMKKAFRVNLLNLKEKLEINSYKESSEILNAILNSKENFKLFIDRLEDNKNFREFSENILNSKINRENMIKEKILFLRNKLDKDVNELEKNIVLKSFNDRIKKIEKEKRKINSIMKRNNITMRKNIIDKIIEKLED